MIKRGLLLPDEGTSTQHGMASRLEAAARLRRRPGRQLERTWLASQLLIYVYTIYKALYSIYVLVPSFASAGVPPMVWVPPWKAGPPTVSCWQRLHEQTSQSTLHGRSGDHATDIIQHTPCIIHHISHNSAYTTCPLSSIWLPTIQGGPLTVRNSYISTQLIKMYRILGP